jgi:HNH endonuclease
LTKPRIPVMLLPTRTQEQIEARFVREGECLVWMGAKSHNGYGVTGINRRLYKTHRLMYEWHVGPIPKGLFVLHTCDNPPCGEPSHLFLGSHRDNIDDMVRKGRRKGQRTYAKLDEMTVSIIRAALAGGETEREIAETFGVSRSTVSHIKLGLIWQGLDKT